MAGLIIEVPPTAEPITLTQAKNYLRVQTDEDDDLINGLIIAAREVCEAFCNRSFCYKGYLQSLDSFPYFVDTVMSQQAYPPSYYALPRYSTTLWNYSQMIKLYAPPLVKVNRISYLSSEDNSWHDLVPIPMLWFPGTVYTVGEQVMDNNGNVQQATNAGTSNANPPLPWNPTLDGLTVEAAPDPGEEGSQPPITWKNMGPLDAVLTNGGQAPSDEFGTYLVDTTTEPGRLFPGPPGGFWPPVIYVPAAVRVHFTAGFSQDGTSVPQAIKTAMLMLVGNWYENREAAMLGAFKALPNHVEMLLWTWRVQDFEPTRG